MRLSPLTKTYLILSVLPAFAGGCFAAMSRGWQSHLGSFPLGRSAPVMGFLMTLAGPLSWYLPGPIHAPVLATLVAVALLLMMSAHSLTGTPQARGLSGAGFVLWWLCGLTSVGILIVRGAV
jgi:hypothetical protein